MSHDQPSILIHFGSEHSDVPLSALDLTDRYVPARTERRLLQCCCSVLYNRTPEG